METMEKKEVVSAKDASNLVRSRNFKFMLGALGVLLIIFVSFAGGVAVGLRKAKFSYQWGQNYERNFMGMGCGNSGAPGLVDRGGAMGCGGRSGGGMMDLPKNIEGRDFRNAHGLAGTVIAISDNNIIVKDRDGKENTVAVTEKTIIKDHMADVKISDLRVDDQIVVMGTPNDQGVISADLIRMFCCGGSGSGNN